MSLSFKDTAVGFASKTDKELKETEWLFRLMSKPFLVRWGSHLAILLMKMGVPIRSLVMATIYKHFCGGRTMEDSGPTINKLAEFNITTMVDYSVEAKQVEAEFEKTANEIIDALGIMKGDPKTPINCIKLTGLGRFGLLKKMSGQDPLTDRESLELEKFKTRLGAVCRSASENGIQLYIDAEETWIQDAMDELTMEMVRKYNITEALVFNTVQLYRKDRLDYLKRELDKAKGGEYVLGIKLVRGAYMEKERARAKRKGYPSPIQNNKADTDRNYNLALSLCLENLDHVSVCAASHNEQSALNLAELLEKHGLDKDHPRVRFAQLFGMSDNISFNLARAGYNISKYVPYGPVREVLPYLTRRAQENTSIAGQMGRELNLIATELKRRKLR